MTFNDLNLNTPLLNALADLEYVNPTQIQRESFQPIMAGRDVIGVAQTGTGKTFAYLLPLLRLLKFSKQNDPKIIVLVPTRELVLQVTSEIEKLTKYMTVRVGGVYGGTNINTQKKIVLDGLEVLVGTPGRLMDLGLCGAVSFRSVKKLVIDEFDEMLQLGFRTQLKTILDLLPKKRQNLLFSATMSQDLEVLSEDFFFNPVVIEIVRHGTPLEQIKQYAYEVPNFYTKVNLLKRLLAENADMSKMLVFCRSKRLADKLFEEIKDSFPEEIDVIHANKSQNYRIKVVQKLKENKIRVLIATDVIARGLDIINITHVLNFDMPEEPAIYLHRIGRTGRADQSGEALSFFTAHDQVICEQIVELMKKEIPLIPLPEDLEISEILIEAEKPVLGGDKAYLQQGTRVQSKGAFHTKKAKNLKVNRAHEKRIARKNEKQRSRRKKRK